MEIISFVVLSIIFTAIPGPNVLVIVATSIRRGVLQGLLTVAGTSLAMIIQLGLAALSTANLLSLISDGLFWLKWFGVAPGPLHQ